MADLHQFFMDPDTGQTLIRIRIQAKNDSVPGREKKTLISYVLGVTGTYFLFSMVFVGSGFVSFDTDPDSGSNQILIRIRIQGIYIDSTDPDPQHWQENY